MAEPGNAYAWKQFQQAYALTGSGVQKLSLTRKFVSKADNLLLCERSEQEGHSPERRRIKPSLRTFQGDANPPKIFTKATPHCKNLQFFANNSTSHVIFSYFLQTVSCIIRTSVSVS